MNICFGCHHALPAESRFCPACGADQASLSTRDSDRTAALPSTETVSVSDNRTRTSTARGHTPSSALSSSLDTGSRFIPGAMIDGRYRIISLLGRGGMGEVYRADDLKLGQPVALKFLPVELETNPDRLERFLAEVRTARQVTHPNVCRVYDIGEVEGHHFLSMEYVDGEDLASLLLRIGRLPQERAVQVSRQICAGLAAAHDQGILHRDLKPANVMVDGRGRVRLTDFGLAGLAEDIKPSDVGSGTPAYMAPEQISGREVTVLSDIYALGLVLFEIFTGRRPFEADSMAEVQRMHTSSPPSSLTHFVQDLDPTVERAVLRCLEKEPADRPESVLAVSAALPGGDPLAAALAAGETPSPELVAEAGERQGMQPGRAVGLALLAILLILGGTRWAGTLTSTHYLPLDRRPEVFEDRARSIIADLGYREEVYAHPQDNAWGLFTWGGVMDEVAAADTTGNPWPALRNRPDAVSFWYRQSAATLLPNPSNPPIFLRGPVTLSNPPMGRSGDIIVLLDGSGQLRRFEVMPTRYSTVDTIVEADWAPLFEMAGLDPTRFQEDRPRYQRFMTPDRRRAWLGTRADQPDVELRVEAGSYEGRAVLFNVATPGGLADLATPPRNEGLTSSFFVSFVLQPVLILLVVAMSVRLANQNLKQSRADRRGALRFSTLTFVLFVLAKGLESHSLFTMHWAGEAWSLLVGATFISLAVWSLYSAAEPLGRQVWPTMFVSSSRLLSRPRVQWLDPLIGQSVLVGLLGGGLDFLIQSPVRRLMSPLWTGEPFRLMGFDTSLLQGQRQALAYILDLSMLLTFMFVFVVALVVIRKFIRRRALALGVTLVVWTLMNGAGTPEGVAFNFITSVIMMILLLRWGVVAMVVSRIVLSLAWQARAADWGAWHAQGAVLVLAALCALAVYGAWAAMGRRRAALSHATSIPGGKTGLSG